MKIMGSEEKLRNWWEQKFVQVYILLLSVRDCVGVILWVIDATIVRLCISLSEEVNRCFWEEDAFTLRCRHRLIQKRKWRKHQSLLGCEVQKRPPYLASTDEDW